MRVHAGTVEIRVARLTSVFAAGRVLNPLTARSQLTGGTIWGARPRHYRNADLAEYLLATAADAPEIEAVLVPDADAVVPPPSA